MRDTPQIDGALVAISIGDPWELVEALGDAHLSGRVVSVGRSPWDEREPAVLIALDRPLEHDGARCEHVVGQARYVGESVLDAVTGAARTCTFSGVAGEDVAAGTAFEARAQAHPRFRGTLSLSEDSAA